MVGYWFRLSEKIHSGGGVYYAVTLYCDEIRASVIKQSEITGVILVRIRK